MRPCQVIAAEDDDELFFLTEHALKELGLSVRRARDGRDLLDLLLGEGAHAGKRVLDRPTVVLLDVHMPGMDGREALRRIKGDSRLNWIPVVMLSSCDGDEEVRSAYAGGANAYLSRPVGLEGLSEALSLLSRHWFELVELPLK